MGSRNEDVHDCPTDGTGGYHSDSFYDDGYCEWCGKPGAHLQEELELKAKCVGSFEHQKKVGLQSEGSVYEDQIKFLKASNELLFQQVKELRTAIFIAIDDSYKGSTCDAVQDMLETLREAVGVD